MERCKMFQIGAVLVLTILSSSSCVLGMFWLDQKPSDCPSGDNGKHVCSSLVSNNFTCVTFDCCSHFENSDVSSDVDEGQTFDSNHFLSNISEYLNHCRVCYAKKACTLYQCFRSCCPGYQADPAGVCTAAADDQFCQNGGTLVVDGDMMLCKCHPGFSGSSCETPVCNCMNGGMCMVQGGRPVCKCPAVFTGPQCQLPMCGLRCLNGGRCVRNEDFEFCVCSPDFVGKQCEISFRQPATCPNVTSDRTYCEYMCTDNADCGAGGVCCREGCSTVCRQTETYCSDGDMMFRVGQSHKPEPCKTCYCEPGGEMPCMALSCAPPMCPGSSNPVRKPGECCYTCPESEPPTIKCPKEVLELYVPEDGFEVPLCRAVTKVSAKDRNGNELDVTYSPRAVRHCKCRNFPKMKVQAWAHDELGNKAVCEFYVIVRDKTPPVFPTCPDDIYIFAEEEPCWTRPVPTDNVGIAKYSDLGKKPEGVGVHKMSYVAQDYDGNLGFCVFLISISGRGTPVADLPQGLKDRYVNDTRMGVFVGVPVGCVILVVGIVALIVYLLRRKQRAPQTESSQPRFDNRLYGVHGHGLVRLPSYKAGLDPPPQYVSTVSLNAPTPLNDLPPTYSNPGYKRVGGMKQSDEHVYDSISEVKLNKS